MSAKGESGLSRWARRKAKARQETVTARRGAALPAAAATPAAPVEAAANAPPQPADVETSHADSAPQSPGTPARPGDAATEDLPDLESLDYESDYSGFLSPDIDESVRNMALRRLWRSNPVLANVDGLVDYDDDFTDAATVIEGMKSIYRVGKGMLQDEETASDAPAETDQQAGTEAQDVPTDAPETEATNELAASSETDTDEPHDNKRNDDG